jgi:hypothetical protein
MNRPNRWLWLACALALAACSGIARRAKDQETQERYLAYAGAPTDRFSYFGHFDNWTALNNTELVVWTSINDAYLLDVQQPCTGLQFATRIGLTSTFNTVNRGLDSVVFERQRCPISQIRPVDYKRLMAERRNAAHPTGQ